MGIVSTLEKIVGPDRVSTSDSICLSYSFNCFCGRDIVRKPDIVVMAETAEQVSEILKAANQYKVPVTPKGAVGGAGHGGPLKGGILLDLALMDRIILIDATNMKAVAEAGCSFFKLSQELFKNGLMLPVAEYGPGPSVTAAAVTPAIGFGETRYGANIDLVEGFEVVLPSGEIIGVGSMAYVHSDFGPYYRHITGPDLVGLFTKSNGAFGIVTKVAYRCLHRPRHWAFHAYYWPSEKIEDFTRATMKATAVEMFCVHVMDHISSAVGSMSPNDHRSVLTFIVNAENEQELNGKEQTIKDICKTYGGTYSPGVAEDRHVRWPTCFFIHGAAPSTLPTKQPRRHMYMFDELVFPSSRLPEIHTKMGELCKKHGLGAGGVGFVMNSQMISWQTMTSLDDSDPDSVERFHKWQSEFREWYGGKGGVFQYRLPPSVPDYVWTNQLGAFNLLKSIKAILDPNNILSPGTFELGEK